MSNIQGRIKHADLEELFMMGELPNPNELTEKLSPAVEEYNDYVLDKVSLGEDDGLIRYETPRDYVNAIKSGKISDQGTLDQWYLIQDIRTILEVKCVARLSQSNNVLADKNTLLAIERVLANKDDYLNL